MTSDIIRTTRDVLKDPLTDQLVRKYVHSKKAQEIFEVATQIVEVLLIVIPLIEAARESSEPRSRASAPRRSTRQEGTRSRRSLPATE